MYENLSFYRPRENGPGQRTIVIAKEFIDLYEALRWSADRASFEEEEEKADD